MTKYDDLLDEIYGEVKLGILTFSPSEIIRELDPIAYRVGMSDVNYDEDTDEFLDEE